MVMHIDDGIRGTWKFKYTAAKLAEGAKAQKAFREGRVAFWLDAKARITEEVKNGGIEVSESIAANNSNYSTQQMGPQVVVRQDLQRKLTECHNKINQHQQAVDEYDGWIRVLEANPEDSLQLTHQDWLYFFGKR